MFPRFLKLSKYELKQYSGSVTDQAVILLVVLTTFLMILIPESNDASLPSAYHIYRVGFPQESILSGVESYYFDMIPFSDKYDMMQANSLQEIDAFTTFSRGKLIVFGSGTLKGHAALSRMNDVIIEVNDRLLYSMISENKRLEGILLPLRLTIIEEEVEYSNIINATLSLQKKKILKLRSFESNQYADETDFQEADIDYGLDEISEKYKDKVFTPIEGEQVESDQLLPSNLEIGLPFKNLYRNMMLLSPSILFSILLALSLARERIDRNIENLLAAPLSRTEILLGKAFPYLLLMVIISVIYGFILSSGFAILKIAYVFMSISITMASFSIFSFMISRSYRELTFIGSFGLFIFFFFIILPNVFSGINVLAFISPLDLVTSIENNADVSILDMILAILPYNFLSLFFLTFTGLCFNAETIFANYGTSDLFKTFYISLYKLMKNDVTYVIASMLLLVPFIFIVESIIAYLVLPLGFIAPVLSILGLACLEEITKIMPFVYRKMNPVKYAILAGISFFISEKLFNLYLITKVYTFLGGPYTIFLMRGFAITMVVHIIATFVLALILSKNKSRFANMMGLTISTLIHFTYNLLIMGGAS